MVFNMQYFYQALVAQLAERLVVVQEVAGSTPVVHPESTRSPCSISHVIEHWDLVFVCCAHTTQHNCSRSRATPRSASPPV